MFEYRLENDLRPILHIRFGQLMEPIISFVIPTYNSEKFVHRALMSLMKQKCKDFEIIIVDDSTDKTLEVVRTVLMNHSFDNYTIIHNNERRGQSYARNVGIQNARGKYIIFLDSDDSVGESLVEIVKNVIAQNEPEIICWKFGSFNENCQEIEGWDFSGLRAGIYQGHEVLSRILINRDFWISTISAAYDRKELARWQIVFSEDIYNGEDLEFTWKCLAMSHKVQYIDEKLSYYTVRENSISRTPSLNKFTNIIAFDRVIKFISENVEGISKKSLIEGLNEVKVYHFLITMDQILYNCNKKASILYEIEALYPGLLNNVSSAARKFRLFRFISRWPLSTKVLLFGFSWSRRIYTALRKSYIRHFW
ncbi:MAG: glycosyltransferase family 2 protein [Methanomassiliicoccales archaeon]